MENTVIDNKNTIECHSETAVWQRKKKVSFPGKSADAGKDNFLLTWQYTPLKQHSVHFLLPTDHDTNE